MRVFACYQDGHFVFELRKSLLLTYILQEINVRQILNKIRHEKKEDPIIKNKIHVSNLPKKFYWYYMNSNEGLKVRNKRELPNI